MGDTVAGFATGRELGDRLKLDKQSAMGARVFGFVFALAFAFECGIMVLFDEYLSSLPLWGAALFDALLLGVLVSLAAPRNSPA